MCQTYSCTELANLSRVVELKNNNLNMTKLVKKSIGTSYWIVKVNQSSYYFTKSYVAEKAAIIVVFFFLQ